MIPSSVARLDEPAATLTDAGIDKDAAAFITFLDRQKQTNRRKGAGVQGYCFSGPFAFHTGGSSVRQDPRRRYVSRRRAGYQGRD